MSWFRRVKDNIVTKTEDKKESPDGLWTKCPECKTVLNTKHVKENDYCCTHCDHHFRIGSEEYFEIFFDGSKYVETEANMQSGDPLKFEDTKTYKKRLVASQKKSGLKDAIRTAHGKINGQNLMIAAMDFSFIGGSMGSVVGEKISRAIDFCIEHKMPLMIISKSGGARMMEATFSLMQMAKTSAKLSLLANAKLPFVSYLTDPTTGGVSASFAMLGDIIVAEPKALIGFAGPRVIKETIRKELPEGFQRSEFLLEKGFLDFIVARKEAKDKIATLLKQMS